MESKTPILINMEIDINRIFSVLRNLPDKERKIMNMRQGLLNGVTHTLEEVGKEFGVTRERIRQIEAQTYERIKQSLK